VEAVMKRTRAAGEERRKMVEMLRVHGEEQGESEAQLMGETRVEEVGEGRLNEIMAALEEGRDVDLTENEMKCFERYLKEI
jgi:anthranilate phosphoribosyltransferase